MSSLSVPVQRPNRFTLLKRRSKVPSAFGRSSSSPIPYTPPIHRTNSTFSLILRPNLNNQSRVSIAPSELLPSESASEIEPVPFSESTLSLLHKPVGWKCCQVGRVIDGKIPHPENKFNTPERYKPIPDPKRKMKNRLSRLRICQTPSEAQAEEIKQVKKKGRARNLPGSMALHALLDNIKYRFFKRPPVYWECCHTGMIDHQGKQPHPPVLLVRDNKETAMRVPTFISKPRWWCPICKHTYCSECVDVDNYEAPNRKRAKACQICKHEKCERCIDL